MRFLAVVMAALTFGMLAVATSGSALAAPPTTFVVTVAKSGTGTGTVTSSPSGINCGSTCSASFSKGAKVVLTATADPGSAFTGWSGACSGAGTCSLTVKRRLSVTATFSIGTHTLMAGIFGSGTGTITSLPTGINCPTTCSANFAPGTVVHVSVVVSGGSTFLGWSGACSGTAPCVITMNANMKVNANLAGTYQPDSLIRLSSQSMFTGSGILGSKGSNEAVSTKVKARRRKVFVIQITNVGTSADTFKITGPGNRRPFTVRYLQGATGTAAITSQVEAVPGYTTASLSPGSSATIRLVVKAKRLARSGAHKSWLITATSTGNPSALDAVLAAARVP